MVAKSQNYTVVIIKGAGERNNSEIEKIIWEHARRNFSLIKEGKLSIACPINDGTEIKGVGIFSINKEETKKIMDQDPAVKAGIFTYEIHSCRGFPVDMLP